MAVTNNRVEQNWTVLSQGYFQDFDEMSRSIGGWSVDFRQLGFGRSRADLLQLGSMDFLVTHFRMNNLCEQRGSTPPGMLTFGIVENDAGNVVTPEGILTDSEIWCFSADREFKCTSQSDFRAYGLSLSESLLDEVANVCEMWDVRRKMGTNRIVRGRGRAEVNSIYQCVARQVSYVGESKTALHCPKQIRELELDLARQIMEKLQDPVDVIRTPMTKRKQIVLRRTLDYLEANPDPSLTVYKLAEVVGAGIRTLEYVFRDYFGVTPKAYLTIQRLIGARRELRRSNAESIRVSDVAMNWGFWHLGRFSMSYRQFFGELPSQTLGRNGTLPLFTHSTSRRTPGHTKVNRNEINVAYPSDCVDQRMCDHAID